MDRSTFRLGLALIILAGLFPLLYNRWRLYQPISLTPQMVQRLAERLSALNLPILGGEDRVAVVAFYSYTCPACQQHAQKYERILTRKLEERGWGYQLAPLSTDPRAVWPSALALCSWELARYNFEALHEALFAGESLPQLPADVEDCAGSGATRRKLEGIQRAAKDAGVVATPSFYLVDLNQTITGVQNDQRWHQWLDQMDHPRD